MRLTYLLPFLVSASLQAQTPAPKQDAPKPPPPKAYADPDKTDEDFPIQGEYAGEQDGKKFGAQIIALGEGKFEAVGYPGGLPGDGWDGDTSKVTRTSGQREAGQNTVTFDSHDGDVRGTVDGSSITVYSKEGEKVFELSRVQRTSPTLEAAPPADAVVLFNGKDKNDFAGARVTEDGLLMEGATSTEKFQDFTVHI